MAGIGVSEPQVRTETAGDGSRRIVVEVPGVSDQQQIRDLVGSTGQLQFIDPQGQQGLTDGQDINALIEAGTVAILFDGGEIDPNSVAPAVGNGNLIGVEFALSDDRLATPGAHSPPRTSDQPGPIALDGEVITVPNIDQAICGGQTIITVGAANTAANEASARTSTTRCASVRCRSR